MERVLKRIIKKILIFLLIAGCLVGLFFIIKNAIRKRSDKYKELIDDVKKEPVIIKEEVEVSSEMIAEELQSIGELATYEYLFTEVMNSSNTKTINGKFNIPFTTTSFIYSYDGVIKAGIDFTQITVEKSDNEKRITVCLPEAKILSCELDFDSFKIYDEKTSIFNKLTLSDVNASLVELENSATEKALSKDILKKATRNAEKMVGEFLRSAYNAKGFSVKVITQ